MRACIEFQVRIFRIFHSKTCPTTYVQEPQSNKGHYCIKQKGKRTCISGIPGVANQPFIADYLLISSHFINMAFSVASYETSSINEMLHQVENRSSPWISAQFETRLADKEPQEIYFLGGGVWFQDENRTSNKRPGILPSGS